MPKSSRGFNFLSPLAMTGSRFTDASLILILLIFKDLSTVNSCSTSCMPDVSIVMVMSTILLQSTDILLRFQTFTWYLANFWCKAGDSNCTLPLSRNQPNKPLNQIREVEHMGFVEGLLSSGRLALSIIVVILFGHILYSLDRNIKQVSYFFV